MKTTIFFAALLGIVQFALAQDQAPTQEQSPAPIQEAVQMHEKMAKAHQQAVECLKSGKTEDECREAFHAMCKDAGGPKMCNSWMRPARKGRMGK